MGSKLEMLYNTLVLVETKGQSTKYMGECLKFLEQMITEYKLQQEVEKEKAEQEVAEEKGEQKVAEE